MKQLLVVFVALFAMTVSLGVHAQETGDAEEGRVRAYTCTGCHGINAYQNVYPTYTVPLIGGQNYEYLVIALNAYREGTRVHPTMRAQAEGMTEQEIRDISAYLSSLAD